MTLRAATIDDMAACAAIFNAWVDETAWMKRVHDREDVVRHYEGTLFAATEVSVVERQGAVRAFIALSSDGFVTALYVDRNSRGAGMGKMLIGAAKHRFPDGLHLWIFAANDGARRFYDREGFVEVRRTDGDNEEGLPDILLHWSGKALA